MVYEELNEKPTYDKQWRTKRFITSIELQNGSWQTVNDKTTYDKQTKCFMTNIEWQNGSYEQ